MKIRKQPKRRTMRIAERKVRVIYGKTVVFNEDPWLKNQWVETRIGWPRDYR